MQIDPTAYQRVQRIDARKANRLRTVGTLPEQAEQGDSVLMGGQLYVHSEGEWTNIDTVVMSKLEGALATLASRVTTLEGGGEDDG